MEQFFIRLNRENIAIEKGVFLALVGLAPHIKDVAAYKKAISGTGIALSELKDLALRASVPFPLFFAPIENIEKQIEDFESSIRDKFPGKNEIALSHRGALEIKEVQGIIADLAKKQEFLKNHVLVDAVENGYTGSLQKMIKMGNDNNQILAETFRKYFDIELSETRKMSKERALAYIAKKAEAKGILVSFSSYNYMPQNIKREAEFSGICVKDKKFPFIFINTRDGDEEPLILETTGRQIFTLISMLVCVGLNIFAFNVNKGSIKKSPYSKIYLITEEVLIPESDVADLRINDIEDLKHYAGRFKVTPSMLLVRLEHLGRIRKSTATYYRQVLRQEIQNKAPSQKRSTLPLNGYKKYNGERFSREILSAYNSRKITLEQTKNILFRKGKKMNPELFRDYSMAFS